MDPAETLRNSRMQTGFRGIRIEMRARCKPSVSAGVGISAALGI